MDMFLERLQGQQLYIDEMTLKHVDEGLALFLAVRCMSVKYIVHCYNISSFRVNGFSFPAIIYGFEVIDNLQRGWQSDIRYRIQDFEEDMISLYCEEIDIICQNDSAE